MSAPPQPRRYAVQPQRLPKPFERLAVRSEEPQHAWAARAPYGWVHRLSAGFLDAAALASLAAAGRKRIGTAEFSEVAHAQTSWAELAAAAPCVADLPGSDLQRQMAAALALSGVLGADLWGYQQSLLGRLDFLASRGAGFHNDVSRHWSGCLFWLLALELGDVEFVMPHAGLRLALAPGDLLVFDQTLAHGLCRPADAGLAREASFEQGAHCEQWFLTGELPLADAQWAALGAPWLPVEQFQQPPALDLLLAQFDECSGAIQGLRGLRELGGGMSRSLCHADGAGD